MNIEDDYLWDKTGEPDAEIQQLEHVLGTLRHQPRSLEIPAGVVPGHKHAFFKQRRVAIAAAIAVILLGLGLWLGFQRRQHSEVAKVPNTPATTGTVVTPNKDNGVAALPPSDRGEKRFRHRVNRVVPSREVANNRPPRMKTPDLPANERKEAEAAKEQLVLALRVASSKLSFAQRKAQEINSENPIHNQHKIG